MENPNINFIDQLADGDLDFKKDFIHTLKRDFEQEETLYFTHKNDGNLYEMAMVVHKMKPKFSIIGMEAGFLLANEYENNLKQHSTEKLEEFEKILTQIKKFIIHL